MGLCFLLDCVLRAPSHLSASPLSLSQNNFSLALKLLKELHRESKAREDWLVMWVQAYCRLSHSRARAQRRPEQLCTALRTASLLGASCFLGGARSASCLLTSSLCCSI